MATLNFHFRYAFRDERGREFFPVGTHNYECSLYPNHTEIFTMFANDPMGGEAYVLYQHRIANGVYNTTSDPNDYNFGFFSGGILNIRHTLTDLNQNIRQFDNSVWTANSWSISNFATFREQIADFLASSIASARILTEGTGPAKDFNDWAVQIYVHQANQSKTFVIYYPGNDPMATHTLTRDI